MNYCGLNKNDIANGQVTLTLTATSIHNDTQQESQITVNVLEDLEGFAPERPIGDNRVDLRLQNESTYYINKGGTSNSIWSLEPEVAGTINVNENQATITWDNDFRGIAALTVKLSNECGESETSDALDIEVFNSTNVSENSIADIKVYPNPAKETVSIKSESIAPGRIQIRIIDCYGKIVLATEARVSDSHFETKLDIAPFKKGLYDIQIVSEKSVYDTPLIVL